MAAVGYGLIIDKLLTKSDLLQLRFSKRDQRCLKKLKVETSLLLLWKDIIWNMSIQRDYMYFCSGWSTFVRDNNIMAGDKITFSVSSPNFLVVKEIIKSHNISNQSSVEATDTDQYSYGTKSKKSKHGKQMKPEEKVPMSPAMSNLSSISTKVKSLLTSLKRIENELEDFVNIIHDLYSEIEKSNWEGRNAASSRRRHSFRENP